MKVESIAAIDVGSNAVRLLINNVEEYEARKAIKKNAYIRVPLRLGAEVFSSGRLSQEKERQLIETMRAFAHLMHVFNVRRYRACATSALREAENGRQVAEAVRLATALTIDIIDGAQEAELILAAGAFAAMMEDGSAALHVDVGGGSTELALYREGKKELAFSLPLGTLRLLTGTVSPKAYGELEARLEELRPALGPRPKIIASGGNINKTLKLLGKKDGDSVSWTALNNFHRELASLTVEERLERYKMNSYRADVIVPALAIFLELGRLVGAEQYIIPKVGLVDGLIRKLHSGELAARQAP